MPGPFFSLLGDKTEQINTLGTKLVQQACVIGHTGVAFGLVNYSTRIYASFM